MFSSRQFMQFSLCVALAKCIHAFKAMGPDDEACSSKTDGINSYNRDDSDHYVALQTKANLVEVKSLQKSSASSCDPNLNMSVNVAYYQSWAVWRDGCSVVNPEDLDIQGNGYTHVVYSFAAISASFTLEAYNGAVSEELPRMARLNQLKDSHVGLKTFIAVGGWSHNDPGHYCTRFTELTASPTHRKTFAESVLSFLNTQGFDGIDLDWEYPGDLARCGDVANKNNYVLLVKEIRKTFENAGRSDLMITMAIPADTGMVDRGFDMPGLAAHLDWFNVMFYDLFGTWSTETGSHTDMRVIRPAAEHMLQLVPSTKLVFGLAAYGRTFTLTEQQCTTTGCPFSGARGGGCPVWDESGYTAYLTIQELIKTNSYQKLTMNSATESMEMLIDRTKGKAWPAELISFDSEETFEIKAKFASAKCMLGYMWWAADMVAAPFRLKHTNVPLAPTTTTTTTTTVVESTSTTTTTTATVVECVEECRDAVSGCDSRIAKIDAQNKPFCKRIGRFACRKTCGLCVEGVQVICPVTTTTTTTTTQAALNPTCPVGYTGWKPFNDCKKYYFCQNGQVIGVPFACPAGTLYDESLQSCDWEEQVNCR